MVKGQSSRPADDVSAAQVHLQLPSNMEITSFSSRLSSIHSMEKELLNICYLHGCKVQV